jgi:UDP-N-acetylglucosamine transferase subunit ALG13
MKKNVFFAFGTHEQEFPRMIQAIEIISLSMDVNLVVQRGYSELPTSLNVKKSYKVMDHSSFVRAMIESDVVISQASPGNLFSALSAGRIPLLIPRLSIWNEHVDDHQLFFANHCQEQSLAHQCVDVARIIETIDRLPSTLVQQQIAKEALARSEENTRKFVGNLKEYLNEI